MPKSLAQLRAGRRRYEAGVRNLLAMAERKGIFDALVDVGNSAGGWEGDLFGIDPLYVIELCILHSLFDVILFAI